MNELAKFVADCLSINNLEYQNKLDKLQFKDLISPSNAYDDICQMYVWHELVHRNNNLSSRFPLGLYKNGLSKFMIEEYIQTMRNMYYDAKSRNIIIMLIFRWGKNIFVGDTKKLIALLNILGIAELKSVYLLSYYDFGPNICKYTKDRLEKVFGYLAVDNALGMNIPSNISGPMNNGIFSLSIYPYADVLYGVVPTADSPTKSISTYISPEEALYFSNNLPSIAKLDTIHLVTFRIDTSNRYDDQMKILKNEETKGKYNIPELGKSMWLLHQKTNKNIRLYYYNGNFGYSKTTPIDNVLYRKLIPLEYSINPENITYQKYMAMTEPKSKMVLNKFSNVSIIFGRK